MHIKRIPYHHIDKSAWDNCLDNCSHSRIYAKSWYLDIVTDQKWDALVAGNYVFIMPLPYVKKWGIRLYIQPLFCQQLGVFWQKPLPKSLIKKFLSAIPGALYDLALNSENRHYLKEIESTKANLIIPLNKSYEAMRKSWSSNHHRNLKKALKHSPELKDISVDEFVAFKTSCSEGRFIDKNSEHLNNLLRELEARNSCQIRGCFLKGQLVSAVSWIHDGDRLVYLQAASNSEGKQKAAAFALVNEMLEKYVESRRIIDFEGSSIPGVARFYQSFGAINESFPVIKSALMKKLFK